MKGILVAIIIMVSYINSMGYSKTYNIIKFGAVPDGKTVNTIAIQEAIDEASASGGGEVEIPSGLFVTGQLFLKSDVELHLCQGAELLGDIYRLSYSSEVAMALIVSKGVKNVSITGQGVINGRGSQVVMNLIGLLEKGRLSDPTWKVGRPIEYNRPQLLTFIDCQQVLIRGITLQNSACWVETYRHCRGVIIDSINVESVDYWNNDGIDIVDSRDVSITNSHINSADDGICLKSEDENGICKNIYIDNCVIRSSASAFKIGTASLGLFENIKVRNLTIYDTYRSAVAIEAVDGATLKNVDIRNINAINTGNAIFIRLGHRNKGNRYSRLSNVYIGNLKAEIPSKKPDLGYPLEGPNVPGVHQVIPSSISGIPGHPVEDVTLEDILIVYEGGGNKAFEGFKADSLYEIPEKIASYPEFSMFGDLPAWGLYVRHAKGLSLVHVTMKYRKANYRPAIIFDDTKQVKMNEVDISTMDRLPALIFRGCQDVSTHGLHFPYQAQQAILNL